jgi:excisionase family DNA binding protein
VTRRRPDDADGPDPLAEAFLRPAEAAKALKVSATEVLRLVRDRRLPALRIGRVVRLHPADVQKFAASRAG